MKRVFLILTLLTAVIGTHAQDIQLTGTVVDEQKVPLVGVTVAIKDQPGIGAITNIDGVFTMKTPAHATLIFSYIGFEKQQIDLKGRTSLLVVMEESRETVIDEVTVTGLGNRKKITVTGAVTTVDPSVLKTPTASLANALAGNVPGIMAMQTTGKPGDNVSEFWIRGISTFGAGSSALVLVDGFERGAQKSEIQARLGAQAGEEAYKDALFFKGVLWAGFAWTAQCHFIDDKLTGMTLYSAYSRELLSRVTAHLKEQKFQPLGMIIDDKALDMISLVKLGGIEAFQKRFKELVSAKVPEKISYKWYDTQKIPADMLQGAASLGQLLMLVPKDTLQVDVTQSASGEKLENSMLSIQFSYPVMDELSKK